VPTRVLGATNNGAEQPLVREVLNVRNGWKPDKEKSVLSVWVASFEFDERDHGNNGE
jgi:hypothetical protein